MAKPQNNNKSRTRKRKSRRLVGSRTYKNYSEEILKLACESVEAAQISSRDAERQFGIPRRTIINKIKNKHLKSVGHPTVLSAEEEKKMVRVLQASSDFGSPLTKMDLKLVVHEYLKKNSRDYVFKNGIPGDTWVQGFLTRHGNELALRTTQNITRARAEKGPQEIAEYFNNLSVTLKDVPADNIVNFDETNLSDDPGSSKGIFRRGVKYPERILNSTKGNISIMFTATASGDCLPLYVVYKSTHLYSEWVNGGPPDTRYNCTKSGWFDSAMFENYFETIILPWAQKKSGTKVLICDNLSSHLSVSVVELCENNNIKFVFIPPRSTHLTQPLDVAYFGPLKKAWRKILYQYKLRNPNQTSLNKKHFPKLLNQLIEEIHIREARNIKSGFRATGISPFNPQEVLKKVPEIQEEILSYGIDQALVDYLKKTRSPNPMLVKRSKKINCEPGRSVTVADLNICCKKDTPKNRKQKVNKNILPVVELQKQHESILHLDEQTGLFIDNYASINNETKEDENFEITSDNISYFFDGRLQKTLEVENGNSGEEYSRENCSLILKTPKTLITYCVATINSFWNQSANQSTTIYTDNLKNSSELASTSGKHQFISERHDNIPNYIRQINQEQKFEAYGNHVKITRPKITILSNVLIKAAKQTTNVCLLSRVSKSENTPFSTKNSEDLPDCVRKTITDKNEEARKEVNTSDINSDVCLLNKVCKTENMPFIAKHKEDLPECLQVGNKKVTKNVKSKKKTIINRKNKAKTYLKKENNKQKLKYKKKKRFACNSSSTSADSSIVLHDTDNSDCETLHNFYISQCLQEQEEKENQEPTEIPFDLSDNNYLCEDQEFKEGDWIVARFATKKSLKHFVGKILSISDNTPKIKFVRKVKEYSSDRGTMFTYPNVDDICTIQCLEDVISVLPEPTISRRGQIIFHCNFRNLNIQ